MKKSASTQKVPLPRPKTATSVVKKVPVKEEPNTKKQPDLPPKKDPLKKQEPTPITKKAAKLDPAKNFPDPKPKQPLRRPSSASQKAPVTVSAPEKRPDREAPIETQLRWYRNLRSQLHQWIYAETRLDTSHKQQKTQAEADIFERYL